jgi:hypothetical protein
MGPKVYRDVRGWATGLFVPLALVLGSCAGRPEPGEPEGTPAPPPNRFDPTTAGIVRGRFTWTGDLPQVPPFKVWPGLQADNAPRVKETQPNPNGPAIDASTRGVGGAVIFLRGIDPVKGKPWDHAPVRVEQRGRRFHVLQGEVDSHLGFVRRGDAVEMTSRDPVFHSLRAGGAAFFTLAFPDPDQSCTRRLNENGVVELSSAAGYYWMRAYLFVDEHPYYTRTDARGRFVLKQVPPGSYEVVCWLPSWVESRHERDPETGLVARLFLGRSVERTRTITLGPKESHEVSFSLSVEAFVPKASP